MTFRYAPRYRPPVYLAAPSSAFADAACATATLIRLGYEVVTPSLVSASAPLAEYLAATAVDLDEVASAVSVVALPGADDLAEVIFAGVMGYPSRRPGGCAERGRGVRLTPATRGVLGEHAPSSTLLGRGVSVRFPLWIGVHFVV